MPPGIRKSCHRGHTTSKNLPERISSLTSDSIRHFTPLASTPDIITHSPRTSTHPLTSHSRHHHALLTLSTTHLPYPLPSTHPPTHPSTHPPTHPSKQPWTRLELAPSEDHPQSRRPIKLAPDQKNLPKSLAVLSIY